VNEPALPLRPCLALPFTVLCGPGRVRLVAGEDFRYTLEAPDLEKWLPQWLPTLDGRRTLADALAALPEESRPAARELAARLYAERVLIDGPAAAAHGPRRLTLVVEGSGPLHDGLTAATAIADPNAEAVHVLCQDRLNYDEALRFNHRMLGGGAPWFWVTCGPLSRGYVSPAFLPDTGPCLECLLTGFRRLSPAPELYAELIDHAARGRAITAAPFPAPAAALLLDVFRWKVELLAESDLPAALYRLHVLEVATLEVSAHRVFADPECPACRGRR
jgi:bacteriocin biosynthesis cyclodehydratase domain-containing protein